MQSCIVLQAGMRMSRSLDVLDLDSNPLGPDGGAAMIEALARRYVGVITMLGCNFSNAAADTSQVRPERKQCDASRQAF